MILYAVITYVYKLVSYIDMIIKTFICVMLYQ